MKRWICPQCSDGINAPSKMRDKDTRRYCLACSAKSPMLVARVAPALEKKRAERQARQEEVRAKERQAARAERERAKATKLEIKQRERLDWFKSLPLRQRLAEARDDEQRTLAVAEVLRRSVRFFPNSVEAYRDKYVKDWVEFNAVVPGLFPSDARDLAAAQEVEEILEMDVLPMSQAITLLRRYEIGPAVKRLFVEELRKWSLKEIADLIESAPV